MWNLKNGTNELNYKTEIRVRDVENNLTVARWEERIVSQCEFISNHQESISNHQNVHFKYVTVLSTTPQ